MRLKTYIATYVLFCGTMFLCIGIVSAHLTRSQVSMLREKSIAQHGAIVRSLVNDISRAYEREAWFARDFAGGFAGDFLTVVDDIMLGYAMYYARHGVSISVSRLPANSQDAELFFTQSDGRHFIQIHGSLAPPFDDLRVQYGLDITADIAELVRIQRILAISAAVFAVFFAVALYLVLSAIFKPLGIIANAANKIALGRYDERIPMQGGDEIKQVALDFNKMAQTVEEQILRLQDEADAKQAFVDNFAHEMRTPLTSIYGYAEYMQKASCDEAEVIESTSIIMSESTHMLNIAASLLELATLRDYVPNSEPVNLAQLFEDIATSLWQDMNEAGVTLLRDVRVDAVLAQEDLLRSLLMNLCINALRACQSGDIISLEACEDEEGVVLIVADDGCGIPQDMLHRIAEPFFRVDTPRTREHGGAGLGLALCVQIARVHGACLYIDSEVGVGSCVRVVFGEHEL